MDEAYETFIFATSRSVFDKISMNHAFYSFSIQSFWTKISLRNNPLLQRIFIWQNVSEGQLSSKRFIQNLTRYKYTRIVQLKIFNSALKSITNCYWPLYKIWISIIFHLITLSLNPWNYQSRWLKLQTEFFRSWKRFH